MDIQPSEKRLERAKEVIGRGGGIENIAAAIEGAAMVEREECARIALKIREGIGTSVCPLPGVHQCSRLLPRQTES